MKRLWVIAGPTGIGKSYVSIVLAKLLNAPIINGDVSQMYAHFPITLNKVNQEEMRGVPHLLFDNFPLKPSQKSLTAFTFHKLARQHIEAVWHQHRDVVVVGGSGFYLKLLLHGPPQHPKSIQLPPAKHAESSLASERRIRRRSDIHSRTGHELSEWSFPSIASQWPDVTVTHLCLYPKDRADLYRSLDSRCEQMCADGMLREVLSYDDRQLLKQSTLAPAIGIRHALQWADATALQRQSIAFFRQWLASFQADTRQLARRQLTWNRGLDPGSYATLSHDDYQQLSAKYQLNIDDKSGIRQAIRDDLVNYCQSKIDRYENKS